MHRSRMALVVIGMGLLLAGCGHQDRIVYGDGDGGTVEEDRDKGSQTSSGQQLINQLHAMEYVWPGTASLNYIIREEGPSAFLCLHYQGVEHREMWPAGASGSSTLCSCLMPISATAHGSKSM